MRKQILTIAAIVASLASVEARAQSETDKLREAILSGAFSPGQKLVEKDLWQSLGISRTVVREALQHLQAEGLINIIPYKGPVVATLTLQDANELYEVRASLESLACAGFAGAVVLGAEADLAA